MKKKKNKRSIWNNNCVGVVARVKDEKGLQSERTGYSNRLCFIFSWAVIICNRSVQIASITSKCIQFNGFYNAIKNLFKFRRRSCSRRTRITWRENCEWLILWEWPMADCNQSVVGATIICNATTLSKSSVLPFYMFLAFFCPCWIDKYKVVVRVVVIVTQRVT